MVKALRAADLRAKTPDELGELLLNLKKEQLNLRFQRATGQMEGVGRVRKVRRDIARIKTVAAEMQKKLAEGSASAVKS